MSTVYVESGALTADGAQVVAKVTDAGLLGDAVRLAVADNSAMSSPVFFNADSVDAQKVAKITATGLASDTQHWFQVEDNGVLDTSQTGRFHTVVPPGTPYSVKFGMAGCAGLGTSFPGTGALANSRISNHPVFDEIRLDDPLFFIHMGDRHYYDLGSGNHGIVGGGSLANYRRAYDDLHVAVPRQDLLYRNVPLVYAWDDHDYGPNDSDGSFVDKANAAQVYRERNAHYPLVEATGPIYHSFQVGRVLFIVLDSRFHRQPNTDPAPRTYLGSAQKTWLDGLLTTPPAGVEFAVLVTPQPIHSAGVTSWGSYTEERDDVYAMIVDNGWIGRFLAVAADQHQFGWDSGTHTAGFPIYTMSSLDSNFGTNGAKAYDLGHQGGRGQYGLIEIFDPDDTTPIRVTATGLMQV